MQVMTHSLDNVPSQEQFNWWLWDLVLLRRIGLDLFWETSCNEKWDELGKWLCNR